MVLSTAGCFALGAIAILFLKNKLEPTRHRALRRKYATYFAIVATTTAAFAFGAGAWLFASVGCIGARELWWVRQKGTVHTTLTVFLFSSLVLVTLVALGVFGTRVADIDRQLFVYLLVFVFDGFSQITGLLVGKRKLAPRLSPGKTWGGFFGGALLTFLLAAVLAQFSNLEMMLLGLAVPLLSVFGDLLASYYKRRHGVKDFGSLLPEHGGVLDRFDSLLFAAAVILPLSH